MMYSKLVRTKEFILKEGIYIMNSWSGLNVWLSAQHRWLHSASMKMAMLIIAQCFKYCRRVHFIGRNGCGVFAGYLS